MNYSKLISGLTKEAFSGKQYKELPTLFKIFAFIGVFPFTVASALLFIYLHVYTFVFNMVSSGVNYLEIWLNETKKDVKHATEAVIHLIALPFIFFMHIVLSFLAIVFFALWFLLQCFLYIATLGGIRWQPYINHANFDESIDDYRVTTPLIAREITACITFGTFAFAVILIILNVILNAIPFIPYFWYYISQYVIPVANAIYEITAIILIPAIFRKATKSNNFTNVKSESDEDKEDDFLPVI